MQIAVTWEPRLIVRLDGRLDVESAEQFSAAADAWPGAAGGPVVCDLAGLEYLSSSGIRSLITVAKTLRSRDSELVLAGAQAMVKRVLDVCGIGQVVSIHETVDDALAATGAGE